MRIRLYALTIGICLYTQLDWMFSHADSAYSLLRIAGSMLLGWALARWLVIPAAAALKIGPGPGAARVRGDSFCLLFALWLGPVFTCRLVALWLFGIDSLTGVEPSLGGIIRGFLSEAACVALLALAFKNAGGRAFRYGTFLFVLGIAALNLEHLLVNASHANVLDAGNALDGSFLFGTVLSFSVLAKFLLLLPPSLIIGLMLAAVLGCTDRRHGAFNLAGRQISLRAVVIPLMIALLLAIPGRYFYPKWVSQGLFEYNIRSVADRFAISNSSRSIDEAVEKAVGQDFFSSDLSGEPVAEMVGERPNILFLVLEGIGYGSMKKLMPNLDNLADQNTSYTRFITQQRQTNRGMYSLLCGDYPNLLAKRPKTDHLILFPETSDCLPERLHRDGGYRTSYVQAARLEYMHKDGFTKAMGFDRSLGSEHLAPSPHSNQWGLDDLTLMDRVVDEIRRLDSGDGPWFVAVLTVGTHHPYNAPGHLVPTYEDAVEHTDGAVLHLMDGLKQEGLDDNLLVIITTDEAAGPRFRREPFGLNQNRGILIASHDMLPKRLIMNNVFVQSDLQLSLLDLLGIDATGAVGRSVFRRYDEETRFTAFANAYTDRFFLLEGVRLTTCTSNMECQSGVFPNGIFGPGPFQSEPLSEEARQRARAMVLMNDATLP